MVRSTGGRQPLQVLQLQEVTGRWATQVAYLESTAQIPIQLYHLENKDSLNARDQVWCRCHAHEGSGFPGAEGLLARATRHNRFLALYSLAFLATTQHRGRGCHEHA